jgi:hypothetical protein
MGASAIRVPDGDVTDARKGSIFFPGKSPWE